MPRRGRKRSVAGLPTAWLANRPVVIAALRKRLVPQRDEALLGQPPFIEVILIQSEVVSQFGHQGGVGFPLEGVFVSPRQLPEILEKQNYLGRNQLAALNPVGPRVPHEQSEGVGFNAVCD